MHLSSLRRTPVLLALLCCAPLSAATRVPLVLNESQPGRKVAWPVTTGVPFPRGQLASAANCRLVDDTGSERPLQARVAATWDAERRSVRWLTIDFIAQPGRTYALEFGPDVRPRATESPLRVEPGERARVSTGALTAEFTAQGPSALGPIRVDLDGDGKIGPDEVVAEGAAAGEHRCIDQDGRVSSSARDGEERRIVVEVSGPVRACVRVDGFYTAPDGRRTLAYRTRYHFFAGLGLVKCLDEFRVVESTKGQRWRDVAFALRLPEGAKRRTVTAAPFGKGAAPLAVEPRPGFRSVSSYQQTYRHYGNPECVAGVVETGPEGEKSHRRGEQAGAWFQASDGRAAVTGSLRWFWQQFPVEWEATPGELRLHLWSPRGGELDFGAEGVRRFFGAAGEKYLLNWSPKGGTPSPISNFFYHAGRAALERGDADGKGVNKHHEFWFHFGPVGKAAEGQEYGALSADQPLALASGEWNCSTDVFGPLAPRPNDSPEEAIVDRLFDLKRYAQDAFGDYGWWLFGAGPHYSYQWDAETKRHYADPRRFEYHTYQKETQLWWCYLRSGERKFHDWALPSENHWVDIAVSHAPTKFQTEWRGGEKSPATLHWPRGDWAIDSPLHFVRHHDTGEAWLRGQAQYWASYHRTLETTTLAYYLTGDERFNDVVGYWRDYWGDLAGKTNASDGWQPWHREQAWYRPAGPQEKPRTWAELIRDYAPFGSGSRHQLTLFFNLATLYEHTWDPRVGTAVREYADAFLDPGHRIGVWRSQDNGLPAKADAPYMSHYWSPALWKYARATGDPRMPEILKRYFDAVYAADPFEEDVGVYSNVQIAYAWYFTRDPRHLRPAVEELKSLRPHGEPLARPEDLGERLYNPYAPAKCFTAVPRLLAALRDAKERGVAVPPAPLTRPQRAPLAVAKKPNVAVEMTLWGYDRTPTFVGPDGKPPDGVRVATTTHASALQPFDRTLPNFEVWLHSVSLPADAPPGWYVLTPKLELAVLQLKGADGVCCLAAAPVALPPGEAWLWSLPSGGGEVRLESAAPKALRVQRPDGKDVPVTVAPTALTFTPAKEDAGTLVRIVNAGTATVWFRLSGPPAERCWLASGESVAKPDVPSELTRAVLPPPLTTQAEEPFAEGKFGKGVLVTPGRTLHLPDPLPRDLRQGTIEFWVKRLWDDRLAPAPKVTFLTNGRVDAWSPWKLPLNEWAHVAVVWRPLKKDPTQLIVSVHVDGLDQAYYRSTYWEGYGNRPFGFPKAGKWLEEFVSRAPPGAAFVLDELRVSSVARYADLDVDFGGQQTFNPVRFAPPREALRPDAETLLLFRFDGDLKGTSGEGRFSTPPRKEKP